MDETRDLAGWIVGLKLGDIPGEVIDFSKTLILDTLGCMLGGSIQESNKAALRYVRAAGGALESTVVNYGDKTSAYNAAFLNGSFGHGWDFDDHHPTGSSHSMSACTAAALALAEREVTNGQDFLVAWIAGYEANHRIGAAAKPGIMKRGFHHVGTISPFAGTGASCKLLRLDEWQTENALSITVSQAAGTFQHSQTTGGAIKRCHMGFAASSGVRSALLAREGMTGPREALEGKIGFIACHCGEENDMGAISRDLGKLWYTNETAMKIYSCCAALWGILDVIYDYKKKYNMNSENVESILVKFSERRVSMIGTIKADDVKDIFGAQFSGRYSIGLALVVGDNRIKGYQQNIPPFGKWREVVETANKVEITLDEGLDVYEEQTGIFASCTYEIKLKNGQVIEGRSNWPKGFSKNPTTKEERLEKFYSQATMVLSKNKADAIVVSIERLEELDDIRPITKLMVR